MIGMSVSNDGNYLLSHVAANFSAPQPLHPFLSGDCLYTFAQEFSYGIDE